MSIISRLSTALKRMLRRGSATSTPATPARTARDRSRPHTHSREIERNLRREARLNKKKD